MKKIFVVLTVLVMSVAAFADHSASCAFRGTPDAYVVAEAHMRDLCSGSTKGAVFTVNVNSYGVKEGAVIVQIQYETKEHGTNTVEKTFYISDGKASGQIIANECAKEWGEFKVNVYNAVCR